MTIKKKNHFIVGLDVKLSSRVMYFLVTGRDKSASSTDICYETNKISANERQFYITAKMHQSSLNCCLLLSPQISLERIVLRCSRLKINLQLIFSAVHCDSVKNLEAILKMQPKSVNLKLNYKISMSGKLKFQYESAFESNPLSECSEISIILTLVILAVLFGY